MHNPARPQQGWTIYRDPIDAPGQYVTRRWAVVSNGTVQVRHDRTALYVGTDLEAARRAVPACAVCLGRTSNDDVKVLETWV
jgi:hypothetical protein